MTHLTHSQRLAFYRHVLVQPPLPPPPSRIPELVFALLAVLSAVALFIILTSL